LLGSHRETLVRAPENQGKQPDPAPSSRHGAGLTVAALVSDLARAVADELESRGLAPAAAQCPALLDRRGLAHALGCGVDTIDRLRREGCPELTLGDAPRFEVKAVIDWLRSGGGE